MAGSNYEVNIKLNLKSVNKQLNNLEKRISRINKLAQGGRASRTVNKNEQEKLKSATKRFQIETRTTREQKKQTLEKRKQFKIDQDNLKLINQKSTGGGRSTGGGVVGGGNWYDKTFAIELSGTRFNFGFPSGLRIYRSIFFVTWRRD